MWVWRVLFLAWAIMPCSAFSFSETPANELFHHRQDYLTNVPYGLQVQNETLKVAFFDLDGTLRIKIGEGETITDESEIKILKNVAERLKKLADEGYFIAIVSNHAWVPKQVSHERASELIYQSIQKIQELGGVVHYYDYAGEDAEASKPATGMAQRLEAHLQARNYLKINYEHSFMVGDDGYGKNASDSGFAAALKIPFIPAHRFFEWQECGAAYLKAQ